MKRFKKKSLIGLAAGFLSVAVIGASFALYKINPDSVGFNINIRTTGDLTYTITLGDQSPGALNPENAITNDLTLGATKSADSTYTQDIVVGTFEVVMVAPNANYAKALVDGGSHILVDVNNDNELDGAGNNFFAEKALFVADADGVTLRAKLEGFPAYLSGIKAQLHRAIAVGGADQIGWLAYTTDVAEKSLSSITLNWADPETYSYAYIVGSMSDSNWADVDKYQMVPNPKSNNFEWMYTGDFAAGDQLKGHNSGVWSTGDNYVIDTAGTYSFYWSGSDADGLIAG